jgi:hypothetical protein
VEAADAEAAEEAEEAEDPHGTHEQQTARWADLLAEADLALTDAVRSFGVCLGGGHPLASAAARQQQRLRFTAASLSSI